MCGEKLRILWLVLAVWLLLPCCCSWADVVLTDEEYENIMSSIEEAKKQQGEQKNKIDKLENELSEAKKSQKNSENITKEQIAISKGLQKSLDGLKKEHKKEKTKSFCWGLAAGIVMGGVGEHCRTR